MTNQTNTIHSILKTNFGYDQFRPLQENIINNVLNKEDSIVLMPTGGGKSLCYQLPALCLEGITLVISPLIALMKDQVDNLKNNGIAAESITSAKSYIEIEEIQQEAQQGKIKILYVAPERLANPSFRGFLRSLKIGLIAIDEAHCISEWGHDFRPDYRNLNMLRDDLPDAAWIALTATATKRVLEDIVKQLHLHESKQFVASFNRENLTYVVQSKSRAFEALLEYLKKHEGESVIIYRFSRKDTESLSYDLQEAGYSALPYHAGLESALRRETQEKFIHDKVQIIVATIAFGMGIDKPDIRLVVHYDIPKSVEGYYQETGRAGRDGLPSDCVLFYSPGDSYRHRYFIDKIEDQTEKINTLQKLSDITDYSELLTCKRKYLLNYFGEGWEKDNCGACVSCLKPRDEFDATEISRKILSAVIKTGERFGANHVINVLKGSQAKQVLQNKHESLSVHGIVKDFSKEELKYVFQGLLRRGLLVKEGGEYPTLAVSNAGRLFLKDNKKINLIKPPDEVREVSRVEKSMDTDFDKALFEQLRKLRKEIADKQDVPPYMVFSDRTLIEMAAYYPQSQESLYRISGVGEQKLKQYGERFLELIQNYASHNNLSEKEIPVRRQHKSKATRASLVKRPDSTYQETKGLINQKMSIEDAARIRGLSAGTIVGHLEKLISVGEEIDLDYLKPQVPQFERVKKALEGCEEGALRPVFEVLNEEVGYEEIRLVRLLLSKNGSHNS